MASNVIVRIARGETFQQVEHLLCNLGNFFSASQQPDREALEYFERLYQELLKITALKEKFEIVFNHIDLTASIRSKALLDIRSIFSKKLLYSHFHFAFGSFRGFDVFGCPSLKCVDYLDVLGTFFQNVGASEFHLFFKLYPNIQIVTLYNQTSSLAVESTLFFEFLFTCRGLKTLDLRCPCLGPDFYHSLPKLDSLRTLEALIITESPTRYLNLHMNWILNSFRYLRVFKSNLVTRAMSADLVVLMRVCATFVFFYGEHLVSEVHHQVIVQRVSYLKYAVTLEQASDGKQICPQARFDDLNALRDYLLTQRDLYIPHWLDGKPMY